MAAIALGLALVGCRPGPAAAALTRLPVPPPPALSAMQPVLWVALAAHLGEAALSLQGAGAPLELRDQNGWRLRADRLQLRWLRQALPQPLALRRRVLGPFASFEAAEQAALAWRRAGVSAEIARPNDWEVWAAADAEPPSGWPARLVEQRLSSRRALQVLAAPGWQTLQGPVQITAPAGMRWQGGVYGGPFRLQPDAHGGWSLVEQVPLERYLRGVVPHEIGASSPPAALAAQAVLARTWAWRNQHRFMVDGYHLCADTQCQVYGDPRQAGAAVRHAIEATAGRVLAWQGQPIHAVYHASNGGVIADGQEAWPLPELPYLRAALDRNGPAPSGLRLPLQTAQQLELLLGSPAGTPGAAHPLFRWQRQLSQADLAAALGARAAALGTPLRPIVQARGPSGRVLRLAIRGPRGEVVLERDAIRRTYRRLPSTLFVLSPATAGAWRFRGGGFGHGAGLSQAGAIDLAAQGWSLERILNRYYPGASLLSIAALSASPQP